MEKGLKMGKKSTASMEDAKIFQDDLSNWEFVNASDLDEDEQGHLSERVVYADDTDEDFVDTLSDGVESWSSTDCSHDDAADDDEEEEDNCEEEERGNEFDYGRDHEKQYKEEDGDGDEDEDEDEDEDKDEDDDLDDELVPRSVSDRFGRQRMRKLGKRACAKMAKSKRLPYLYTRPGCVHGKHGLGLKYNF